MTMTYADMATFVRSVLEVDATELPDVLLRVFANSAYADIIRRKRRWPHLYVETTFDTVAEQRAYLLSDVIGDAVRDPVKIIPTGTPHHELYYLDHDVALATWVGSTDVSSTPDWWSYRNGTVYLWPRPADVLTFTITGYRRPAEWDASASATPDLPAELHEAVAFMMTASCYDRQEDFETAARWEAKAEKAIDIHMRDNFRPVAARPIAYGRNMRHRDHTKAWVESLGRGEW